MGLMTLEDFRRELNHSLGGASQPDNKLLDIWINRAYFEAANVGNQQHLKMCVHTSTVSHEGKYTMPGNLMEILSAADLTSKRRLIRTSIDDYHLKDRDVKGAPRYYVRRAGSIMFWPTPNRSYDIELIYVEEPAQLVEHDDRTVIPNVFDHAVSLFAARNAFLAIGNDEKATLRHQSAVAYLREQQDEMEHSMGSIKEGFGIAHSFEDLTMMRNYVP